MSAILDFLQGIGDFIVGIGDNLLRTITGQQQAIQMITDFVANLQSYLAWVPDSVYVVMTMGFSVCCLYVVLGRC